MSCRVRLSPLATNDLILLHNWVEAESDWETARAYVIRVRGRCNTLSDFPNRGTPRDELGPGVRSLSFEGRLILLYRADADEVVVLRVISTARDIGQITLQ